MATTLGWIDLKRPFQKDSHMGNMARLISVFCLLFGILVWTGRSVSGQEFPSSKPQKTREANVSLSFRYLEGDNLSVTNKTGSQDPNLIFSEKDLSDWLVQVSKKSDIGMMKDAVEKIHSTGPASRDHFSFESDKQVLCNYQVALKDKGSKFSLNLMTNIWMGDPKNDFFQTTNLDLADGETVVLQSPQPGKNINRLLLVTIKKRPISRERTVRLELRFIEGESKSSPGRLWSCFGSKYQFGVPEKEVEEWLAKSGAYPGTQTDKIVYQDLKNTENWTIVDHVYRAPTDFLPEIVSGLTDFFFLKIIKPIDCTEADLFTSHGKKIQLFPDPSNENSSFPFILKTELSQKRGDQAGWIMEARRVPKPGHIFCLDLTKPNDSKWKILIVRAVK